MFPAHLADMTATAKRPDDIRQAVTDKAVETIQILPYGASASNSLTQCQTSACSKHLKQTLQILLRRD